MAGENKAESKKQVFLFVTHFCSEEVLKEFDRIREATKSMGDCFLLYHKRDGERLPKEIVRKNVHEVTNSQISSLGYKLNFPKDLVSGYNNLLVMEFSRRYHYKYYWVIEYDVRFTGSWKEFFKHFNDYKQDFLTCCIERFTDESDNPWWNSLQPSGELEDRKKLRSFNPLYRISRSALDFLDECYRKGWRGHFEVLYPTLLYNNCFEICDLGGYGEFVQEKDRGMFYDQRKEDCNTYRYRPIFRSLLNIPKNKLVHPLKKVRLSQLPFRIIYFLIYFRDETIDWEEYIRVNPDLRKNWGNYLMANIHFLLFGKREKRQT